jgi:signal transduction histidine kinase
MAARDAAALRPFLAAMSEHIVHLPAPLPTPPSEVEALRRRLVRLAFDVHDGPMQSLTAVGYGLHDLHRDLVAEGGASVPATEVAGRVADLIAELGHAESDLRGLISLLEHGSPEIDTVDVIAAAELKRFSRYSNANPELIVDPPHFQPDTHSQALAIRSVLREALNNVARHAEAREVLLRIQAGPEGVLVEIGDDGAGFDPDAVSGGSIGLSSMRERVDLLGGSLDVLSRPGGPTVVTALFTRWRPPEETAPVALAS